jgi:HD-GYP domain-containing protein (c-di-GMP phosphodiesterase class II)
VKQHVLVGSQILAPLVHLREVITYVRSHHERWDGFGYPDRLRGEAIPPAGRIVAVADAFDAMTSDRVYRRARSYEAAAAELDEWAGRQFDPHVVEVFHRVPPEDWEELRRLSVMKKQEKLVLRQLLPTVPDYDAAAATS